MTETPLQNEYNDAHSSSYGSRPGMTSIDLKNAVLALTCRAFVLRLRIADSFNGRPVVVFKPPVVLTLEHELSEEEQDLQEATGKSWRRHERHSRVEKA